MAGRGHSPGSKVFDVSVGSASTHNLMQHETLPVEFEADPLGVSDHEWIGDLFVHSRNFEMDISSGSPPCSQ